MARLQTLLSFVLLACTVRTYASIGPEADLVISNGVVSPDGFSRSAVLAGGNTIGPLIVGNKGDSLKINVVNKLDDNTMLQSTSIYCDGLRGAIVIYDPQDPYKDMYDVDDESTVITLADWYHEKAKTLVDPTPDSTLINGLGRWKKGGATELAVIQVEQGKRYRMRLVNTACEPDYIFSIDNHAMTVIEADSINHEPVTVNGLRIFIGQRYSFILEANQPVGNYWIHADPSIGDNGFNGGINSAILRYIGAPEAEPANNLVQSFVPPPGKA
ncbi:laccase, multicopper oxidase, benzenediol:oxygen oxidorectuctase [Paramarasmius palmivorus]|uniref:Laccase, multicopper oxidase, benzenediol:oxygen oxidorectuctase n=1 Tax=Paramarasmius palmivorus TaxID=297713 RepID=A0AAW0BJ21_9AGAR